MSRNKFYRVLSLVLAVVLLLAFAAPTITTAQSGSDAVLTFAESTMPTFTSNFNPFNSGSALPGTLNVIHEPLMIFNSATGELMPWLATGYSWSDDLLTLTFTLRDSVLWSDGEPFTASDVAFTFNLLKTAPGVNSASLSALTGDSAYVDSITAPDDHTVVFSFSRVYTPGLFELITQVIVPEHIWSGVTDVVAFTNDTPVGTGPFTELANFTGQSYELDKNPHYWQEGKPTFKGVVYEAFADGNAASLAMANGEIDWSNLFIVDPANNFVAADAANRYFIMEEGPNMGLLAMNETRAPFDNADVRRAISMAINRDQISLIGEGGVVSPTDVTGLTGFYNAWKVADVSSLGDWTTYNPDAANQLLDAAGLTRGSDGIRVLPDGTRMSYDVMVLPAPNWIADLQIASENLADVGIELNVVPNPNFPEWLQTQQTGNFDMIFSIVDGNATPFRFYRMTMSSELLAPEGTAAQGNYSRYSGGAADDLLTQFSSASSLDQEHQIVDQLQQVFASEVPAVPLVPLGGMGLINTTRFTGFPTTDNYYASAQPNPTFFADILVVLTTITPK
ncbi:MAG: ABC transporter substrate-binding protein [Anaerolineae bacterium]